MIDGLQQHVLGPDGTPLTIDRLPSANARWTAVQKATVIIAVRSGLISLEAAYLKYALSSEEFASWAAAFDRDGYRGLRLKHKHESEHA